MNDHLYGRDGEGMGNITSMSDALDLGYSRNLAYDDLNRLTTANAGTKLWSTATGNGYAYDAMGNIKSAKLGSVYASTFTYKAGASGSTGLPTLSNVLENGKSRTVTYDALGNEAGDAVNTFAYSPRELLGSDSTQISAYYYDGNRQRVSTTLKTGNARDSFFDPQQHLLAETAQFTSTTTSPAISEEYIWFGDMPVAQIDGTTTRWTYTDHLGTPQIQTDLTGAVQWQAEYEPYGTIETLRKNDVHQPLRFPGQVSEQFDTGANGLTERSFNNARWSRSNWGRYTQADPIGLGGGIDVFGYSRDNPIKLVDSSGLIPNAAEATCIEPIDNPICYGGLVVDALTSAAVARAGSTLAVGAATASLAGSQRTCQKDPCKGLREKLQEHEKKLSDYLGNPMASDNKGFQQDAIDAGDYERLDSIRAGRIANLERQISNFRRQLEECEKKFGIK